MAPMRASLAFGLTIVSLVALSLRADDGKKQPPEKGAKPANPPAAKGSSPSPEQLKECLAESLKIIKGLAERAEQKERQFAVPEGLEAFTMRFTRPLHADVLRVTALAQARLGDLPAARATWQKALDAIAAASALDDATERVGILTGIAEAQVDSGEREESRFTIRQTLQLARTIGSQPNDPPDFPTTPGMELGHDVGIQKSRGLMRIARVQDRSGDKAGSLEAWRQTTEIVESIKDPSNKIQGLVEMARGAPADLAGGLWDKALALALRLEEYQRFKGVGTVIRGRVDAGQIEPALTTIAERLTDDLKSYALWTFADAVAASNAAIDRRAMERAERLAEEAAFDRAVKKRKVYQRIAEARARLGDYEGANHTVGLLQAENDVEDWNTSHARLLVMTAIAEAQLAANKLEAAKETAHTVLETILPQAEEGTELILPLSRLGVVLAKAGDIRGAEEIAESLTRGRLKAQLLAEIAAAHAALKQDDAYRAAIRRAVEASHRMPNDLVWEIDIQLDGAEPLQVVNRTLATTQARMGDLDACVRTLSEMGKTTFGIFNRNSTIEEIIGLRLDANDLAGARRVFELYPVKNAMFVDDRSRLHERIARQQARTSDPSLVLEWARKEATPRGKLVLLRGLADGIAERLAPPAEPKNPAGRPKGSS